MMDKEKVYFVKLDKEDLKANRKALKDRLMGGPSYFPEHTVEMMNGSRKIFRVSVDKVFINENILKSTRKNPLFEKLNFQSTLKLKRYINSYRSELESILEYYEEEEMKWDKIDLWINRNIPKSSNKDCYKKAFKVVLGHPKPKDCSATDFLDPIHEKFEPKIGDQSLRKKITLFIRDLPL